MLCVCLCICFNSSEIIERTLMKFGTIDWHAGVIFKANVIEKLINGRLPAKLE